MPDRPVLAKVPRNTVVKGVSGSVKKVTHWDQMTRGQRAQRTVWLPTGQEFLIQSTTGQTGAISPAVIGLPTGPIPRNAVSLKLIGFINANTVTAGSVKIHYLRDADSTGVNFTESAYIVTCPMFSATYQVRFGAEAPIVRGGVYWYTQVTGTVNYDISTYVVGFVLE